MNTESIRLVHTDASEPKAVEIEQGELRSLGVSIDTIHCKTEDEVITAAGDADGILTVLAPITRRVIERLTRCRLVARYGVGVDNVDLQAATERGIVVIYFPDYCVEEVSDHAIALLLACARSLVYLNDKVKKGSWGLGLVPPLQRLKGKNLGLVGFGRIARAVAAKAKAFGLSLCAYDPSIDPAATRAEGVDLLDLDSLLSRCDFVSVHAPLTELTRHSIGARELRLMKPSAFIINTSRGSIIDEAALATALRERWIAGAALDVLEKEPPEKDNPLLAMENVIVTPHMGFYSLQARRDLRYRVAQEVSAVLTGRWPTNVANPEVRQRVRFLNDRAQGGI